MCEVDPTTKHETISLTSRISRSSLKFFADVPGQYGCLVFAAFATANKNFILAKIDVLNAKTGDHLHYSYLLKNLTIGMKPTANLCGVSIFFLIFILYIF